MKLKFRTVAPLLVGLTWGAAAMAGPVQDQIDAYAKTAGVAGFNAADGEALFQGSHTGGNPETPSCTTCHTTDPHNAGRTRVGKTIAPMAVSATPDRFSDPVKVEKWFLRNCKTVLGRECSPAEKGAVLTYLSGL